MTQKYNSKAKEYYDHDHLYEGRFTPTNADGKRISRNIYAKTREECEEKLAELIKTMKAEIVEMKKAANA